MRSERRAMRALNSWAKVALCAAVLGGCQGAIGDPRSGPEEPDAQGAEDGAVGPQDAAAAPDSGGEAAVPQRPIDPQRVTIHRLNRSEYNNTVRDLFGTRTRPADEFPQDDRGFGFDNIADVLSVSPLHLEQYDRAAEALVDEALGAPAVTPIRTQLEAESLRGSVGAMTSNGWNLWSNGEITANVTAPGPGRYRLTVRAWQSRAGTEDARMALEIDGAAVRTVNVPNVAATPGEFTAEFTVMRAGSVQVGAAFLNDYLSPDRSEDRNLFVDWLRVEGPLDAAMPPASRARWITCDPAMGGEEPCATQVLARFGRRAWRRPLADAEVRAIWTRFRGVTRMHAGSWEDAIRLSMRAMLVSPHFVFRVEVDPNLSDPAPHPLTDHELASRLSYFLWSSMPDEALDRVADAGMLRDPAVVRAQIARMLADPKARGFVENFSGQWLYTRMLEEHDALAARFPRFDAAVRAGMRAETEAYFEHFLRSDVSMSEFLTAGYSFIDERLAGYYGLTLPAGMGVRRVSLEGTPRLGFLMQGSLLTVTSHADRTSPVKRGQWVLQQLLCTPPPPPPPSVEGLPMEAMPSGSLRQRFEAHRNQPLCRACHEQMDPIGFGLENFDAVGVHRTMDGTFPVDSTGVMPDGTPFDGPQSLARIVQRDPRFPRCVTRQMLTYALGRGLDERDDPQVNALATDWVTRGQKLRELVESIALSPAFTQRRAETPTTMP
jgi:hypothetical protein